MTTNDQTITFTGFRPHPGQKEVLKGFSSSSHKFCTVSTGRQYGKSLLGINMMLYWTLNNSNVKGGWIAPVYQQSKKVFDTISLICKKAIVSSNRAELSIKFVNGSSIKFLSSERWDNIRGYSFQYLVVDEAAYIKKVAMSSAILPTLTVTGKKCLLISTPTNKSTWFYEYYLKGLKEDDTYISFTGKSLDNPFADKNFILEQKKSLPDAVFAQEYLGEFSDAGASVFKGVESVCILKSWPGKAKDTFFAIDTGLVDDYSVLTLIDTSGTVRYMDRVTNMPLQDVASRFVKIIKQYSCVNGYIETNGIGRGMYDAIRGMVKCKDFVTTSDSKTLIIRSLIQDIEEQSIELPSKDLFPDLFIELNGYDYKVNANGRLTFGGNGVHDDTVMSLAMANHARRTIVSAARSFHVGGSGGRVPKANTTFNIDF